MLKFIIIAFLFLLLLPVIHAVEYNDTCKDTDTLNRYMTFVSCENENCTTYNFTQDIPCKFGCDTSYNRCNDEPYKVYLYIIIGLVAFMILVILVLKR